jgi:UDPglucose 6-dehydrogenase
MAVLALKNPSIKFFVLDFEPRISQWNSEQLPIFEPGLEEVILATRNKNLFFTTNAEEAINQSDIVFISVNTPTKTFGHAAKKGPDLRFVESAARTISSAMLKDPALNSRKFPKILVEKSTVPIRTGEIIRRIMKAELDESKTIVLSNPEFMAEGTAIKNLLFPDRVVIGGDQKTDVGRQAIDMVCNIYRSFVPHERILTTELWSAELGKIASNAMLAMKISAINSFSQICEESGADIDDVAKILGTDQRIGPQFLKPSVGFGGSCFEKDLRCLVYLCRGMHLDVSADFWEGVLKMNNHQRDRFSTNVIRKMFSTVTGKKIAILGFAFKKDTGDVRETSAAFVSKALLNERAVLHVYDPKVTYQSMIEELDYTCDVSAKNVPNFEKVFVAENDVYEATKGAHAICILTEWDQFKTLDYKRIYDSMLKPAFIFDGRNILDHEALQKIGFDVSAIGKPLESEYA